MIVASSKLLFLLKNCGHILRSPFNILNSPKPRIWMKPSKRKAASFKLPLDPRPIQSESKLTKLNLPLTNRTNQFFFSSENEITKAETSCKKSTICIRHRYAKELEDAVNEQILAEFNASFAYLSMAVYFGRIEVALPGCQGFFMNMFLEEQEHATIFINYQLMRGGQVTLFPVSVPENIEWDCIEKAFCVGVEMEKLVKEKIEHLSTLAEKNKDFQLVDFLAEFLEEQNRSICKFGRLLAKINRMGKNPVGEHLFDKLLFDNYIKSDNFMYKDKPPSDIDTKYM